MYTQEVINIGQLPNDGEGDPLRVAYAKINNNFSNLFTTFVNTTVTSTTTGAPGQIIFQYPANSFTQGQFYISSRDLMNENSQTVTLNAQLNNTTVAFTGYGTTVIGNPLVTYDMSVVSGNVKIVINPLISTEMTHLVSSQVMWSNQ